MGKIIEGVWDCTYCGAKKVRGSLRECPQCGHPRDEDVTFYMDNPQNYVLDEAAIERARKGPDWVCPSCDCLNTADNTICEGCGTPRDADTKDYFQNQQEKRAEYKQEQTEWKAFHSEYKPPAEPPKEPIEPPKQTKRKKVNWAPILKVGITAILIIAVIAGMVALFTPKTVTGTIEGMSWSRSVEIEEYKTVRESDWAIPPGGREVSRSEELHHYDQVLSHYKTKTRTYTEQVLDHYEEYVSGYRDLGNGYFQEITSQRPVYKTVTKTETYQEPVYTQVPVYKTKYTYDIEKWVHKSYEKTSGSDKTPYWSDYQCETNERIGSKTEAYITTVKDADGKIKDYTLSFEQWNSLDVGDEVELKAYITGSAELIIDQLK